MKRPIIAPEQSLTFSDYFRLNLFVEDVANHFGYQYEKKSLDFTSRSDKTFDYNELTAVLERNVLSVDLTSETARREFLIAPVLSKLIEITTLKIRVEYPIEINHQLKGNFDYLLKSKRNFVLIEAKNADLVRGFTQLAVELIAFDKADENEQEIIYGAISIGDIWRFGALHRADKLLLEDVGLFRVPLDLKDLMQILIGILEN
ncbi:MAG: hypothetical protein H7Z37_13155 [Pyrinomonadaceae bacterium]|nr:hypothetical protein [Pyrinomonadaceae bacterium]